MIVLGDCGVVCVGAQSKKGLVYGKKGAGFEVKEAW